MSFATPFLCVYFFAKGYNMSHEDQKKPFKIVKRPKITQEEILLNKVLENIDAYDGTSAGQKEII